MAGIVISNKVRRLVGNRLKEIDVPTSTLDTALYYADLSAQGVSFTQSRVNTELNAYPITVKNNASLVLTPSANKVGAVYAMNGDSKTLEEFEFQRGSSGTYFNASGVMQLAAPNVPRINYENGVAKGLLIESASSNLILFSGMGNYGSFQAIYASDVSRCSVVSDAGKSAIKVVPGSSFRLTSVDIQPNKVYTYSFWIKAVSAFQLNMRNYDNGVAYNATVHNITTEWQRIVKTFVSDASAQRDLLHTSNNGGGSHPEMFIADLQLEEGSLATSYIPTTSAIATRLADKVLSKRATAVYNKNSINVRTAEYPVAWLGNGIENLNIAGRNLLLGTRNVLQNIGSGLKDGSLYQGYAVVKSISTGAVHEDTYRALLGTLTRGTTYIVSFYAKASINMDIFNYFYAPNTTISGQSSTGQTTSAVDGGIAVSVTTSWQKYWIKWTQTDTDAIKTLIIGRIFLNSTGTVELAGFKFEHGTTETAWSPAPEDYIKVDVNGNIEISYDTPIHIQQFSLISRELKQEEV